MGTLMSKKLTSAASSMSLIIKNRKRKRSDSDDDSSMDDSVLEKSMHTPKRKKLLTTAQYIYQALFKEERSSDVAVRALGKTWHLHKIYLCQSPYFNSMFSGGWRESTENYIHIEIEDPRITLDSLYVVFGSLYLDEVTLEPLEVTSVLATASLFQLDGLIDKCAEVMCETCNIETAVSYYETATTYGVQTVKEASFKWLLVNLLGFLSKNCDKLRTIDVALMQKLVASPELCVMQTEFSLYIILRTWMFLKLFPDWDVTKRIPGDQPDPSSYFSKLENDMPFLLTSTGSQFEFPFRALRIQNLLNHNIDIKVVKQDNIIPISWLYEPLFDQWVHTLQIDQSIERGPKDIDQSLFYETCTRCGRILQEEGFQKWRWTGFNFGLDLVMIADTRTLSIKRHHRTENERLLSLQVKRQFLIKVTLISLNELRQVRHSQSTEIKHISLDKNEEVQLMKMDSELVYPLLISVSLLVVTPSRTNIVASTSTLNLNSEEPGQGRSSPSTKVY